MREAIAARRIVAVLIGIVLAVTLAQPAQAAPVRSGTIIGGFFPFAPVLAPGPPAECAWNVDCLAWMTSGCNPAMVGVDPGLHSSIVDVAKLAGSRRTREFFVLPKPPGFVWGGVAVELWYPNCNKISLHRTDSGLWTPPRFKIPSGAAWMTVSSMDTTSFAWELR